MTNGLEPPDDGILRRSMQRLAARRGVCPEETDLVAYQTGALDGEREAAVREHVLLCADCELELEQLKHFDRATAEAQRRTAENDPREEKKSNRIWRFLWNPAFAYALVVVLAFPAWRGMFRPEAKRAEVPVERKPVVMAMVPEFAVNQTRSAGGAGITTVTLHMGETRFLLSLLVPEKEGARSFADLHDAGGTPVGSRQEVIVGAGNRVVLEFDASGMQTGVYRVTVGDAMDYPFTFAGWQE